MFCKLKPRSERKLSADEVIQELRKELSVVPGIRAFPGNPPVIRLGSRSGKADYQFTLQCTDTDDLYKYAGLMESELRAMPELQDVGSDVQLKNPTLKVNINRDKAASMGLSIAQIETALYGAYGSREVSTMYMANDQYSVIMGLMPEFQRSAEALSLLYLRSTSGELVPLKAVADVTETVGPLAVNHSGQLPSATLFFNLKSGVPLGHEAITRSGAGIGCDKFPGNGTGVPGFDKGADSAAGPGNRRDLHGAGNPLRELLPPHHHPLRPSLRRGRRASGAHAFPRRTLDVRIRGNHHARRPREEERHHDD
jgi:hypothetical protein